MDPNNKPIVIALGSAFITGILALLANFILIIPQTKSAQSSFVEALIVRVETLEESLVEKEHQYKELLSQNTKLQLDLATIKTTGSSSIRYVDVICNLLEARPGKNWAKIVTYEDGVPVFTMACLNSNYAAGIGISKLQYIGYTDFDVWKQETAQGFYTTDLQVLQSRGYLGVEETWETPQGVLVQEFLTKFYFLTSTGDEYIIGSLYD